MLPSILAGELQQGIGDFLRTTFPSSTPRFHGMLKNFLTRDGSSASEREDETSGALFKGPYVSLQLPFAGGDSGPGHYPQVPLDFPPYAHQARAFERIEAPHYASTLVATGTGSGKTEAFLWPILEHVRVQQQDAGGHAPGIKALLIYPMNALANDQAGRIADAVDSIDALSDVRVGLYVGQRGAGRGGNIRMASDEVITDREALRLSPPDVLMTNYKMLDYLLTRPRDQALWQHNGPETLRYLVVDELHTFDGAQGTDLACLLRRLKSRLGTPEGHLCCVGTSATLGGTQDAGQLRRYAEDVFGEPFGDDAIIGEERVPANDFLAETTAQRLPTPEEIDAVAAQSLAEQKALVAAHYPLWFGSDDGNEAPTAQQVQSGDWRLRLGRKLRSHVTFRHLLGALEGEPQSLETLADALAERDERWACHTPRQQQRALEGFLALIAWARGEVTDRHGEHRLRPLVDVRLQLWLRELRRMVASVENGEDEEDPSLAFWDDLTEDQRERHLPVVHCLDCGAMGWVGRRRRHEQRLRPELQAIYRDFFDGAPTFDFAFPHQRESGLDAEGQFHQLCGHDLALSPADADACDTCGRDDSLQRVFVPHNRRTTQDDRQVGVKHCPYCNSQNSLMIVGSRAASLTSVLISQLFASSFNADKKLITFSDAVQDAAHRAGFFEARTFRFNLRAAIQQFVEARETEGLPLTLDEIAQHIAAHWQEQMGDERFAATFIAPDMQWFRDFEHLREQGRLPKGSNLPRDVARRVSWEAWSEYGFRARIGRTLEKSGASVAAVDPGRLQSAVEHILPRLRNQIGELREVSGEAVETFLRQLVVHRKNQGGIFHPELRGYVEGGGNYYVISGQHRAYMPRYGRFARLPAFIAERSTNRFDPVVSQERNWLAACAVKHLGDTDPLLESQMDRLYAIVLGGLVEANVMDKRSTSRAGTVWGLRPDALHVRTEVAQIRCRRCGHRTSVAEDARAAWTGSPCLRYECPGTYGDPRSSNSSDADAPNYYRRLYRHSALRRVVAREHTGLLDRPTREQLERDFKREEERAWDPNVLSCTPTLEMGVDIGALSAVFLCSVPPAPSNFVQRVGRAGRRSGNALDVTVAGGQPHDLYYFADPKAMIAGRVEPPGVFLGAVAVLFRQFTAFCFDEWVSEDLPPDAVPSALRRVLSNLDDPEGGHFPHNWLAYVEERESELLASFLDLFEDVLSDARAAALRAMITGDGDEEGTRVRVLNELQAVRERRRNVQRRSRQLQRDIRALEDGAGPVGAAQEEELADLKREKKAMQRLFYRIGDAETFSFFTYAGLLPNYAFPEKGVTLRSILYRTGSDEGNDEGSVWDAEYVRPASRAITELAPGNHFYAEGRKVQIDQVALDGEDALQVGRLCDRCGHVAPSDAEESRAACPRCGSPHWSDAGQQRPLVRMEEVMATTPVRQSRIDDSSDNRSAAFYDTKLLTSVDRDQVEHAYEAAGNDAAFGYEFVRKATFREVNFGPPAPQPQMTVGGQEIHGKGFPLCPDCGRVEKPNGEIDHTRSCPVHRSDHAEEQRKHPFLYREVASEALRILLPEGTLGASTQRLRSFRAALMMGLEEVFSGTVYHLKATVQETPDPSEIAQRRYLVLYDAVPGGTGYLAELSRSEGKLMNVIEAAQHVLKACPCQHDPDKDGCYQCLYAYRDSYHLPQISRREALTQLRSVLDQRGNLVETDTIDNISLNPLVDSVLERRFLEKLGEQDAASLDDKPVRGKTGYVLRFGERRYEIEPQVTLGPDEGIARALSVDFMIRPQQTDAHGRPIAVFLDGLQYHRERIGKDLAQRRALQASGAYRVWSLTWEDLEKATSQQPTRNLLTFDAPAFGALLQKAGEPRSGTAREIAGESSFAWLVRYLSAPDPAFWQRLALVQALLYARSEWDDELSALPPGLAHHLREKMSEEDTLCGTTSGNAPMVRVWAGVPKAQINQLSDAPEGVAASVVAAVCFDDEAASRQGVLRETWNGVLRLHNLLQFLPDTHVVTSDEEAFAPYDDLLLSEPAGRGDLRDWLPSPGGTDGQTGEENDEWRRVMEYALEETVEVLQALRAVGAPPPQMPPFELTAENGRIDGVIELAWPSCDMGVALPADEEHIPTFEARGWTVWPLAQARQDPDALAHVLAEGNTVPVTN